MTRFTCSMRRVTHGDVIVTRPALTRQDERGREMLPGRAHQGWEVHTVPRAAAIGPAGETDPGLVDEPAPVSGDPLSTLWREDQRSPVASEAAGVKPRLTLRRESGRGGTVPEAVGAEELRPLPEAAGMTETWPAPDWYTPVPPGYALEFGTWRMVPDR